MKRTITFLILILTCISCREKPNSEEIEGIEIAFQNWQKDEICNGKDFLPEEKCNPEVAINDTLFSNEIHKIWGFPDEIKFSYGHLNNDNKLDALITFNPLQCDGGNMSMWIQIQLIALSEGKKYRIEKNYFDTIGDKLDGFYHLEKIRKKGFVGKYYEFSETDPHCCPSIKKEVFIDFMKKTLTLK